MREMRFNDQNLSDIFLVANTPTFLYERFRRDPSVQSLGKRFSGLDIALKASSLGENANSEFVDRVRYYACLVALSFKSPAEQRQALTLHPLSPVMWSRELAALSEADGPSGCVQIVEAVLRPSVVRDHAKVDSAYCVSFEQAVFKPMVLNAGDVGTILSSNEVAFRD
jgi:hypothetical protein